MEEFHNADKTVTKYLHEDGSETCIKIVPSSEYMINSDGDLIEVKIDKQKYSVLISISSGCKIGCKFCYLGIKKYPYSELSGAEIYNNVINAIKHKISEDSSLRDKYIKLCWMGMGDAFLEPRKVYGVTKNILNKVFEEKWAKGLDGVDIGTVFPKNHGDLWYFSHLNSYLYKYETNLCNIKERSPLRIFYSLHKYNDRDIIIPNGTQTYLQSHQLRSLKTLCNIDVIYHYIFLDGINDIEEDIKDLKYIFNNHLKDFELRILRYNECSDSPYKESSKFDSIVKELNESIPKIKYQISPGSEIKAACGQFIMKRLSE